MEYAVITGAASGMGKIYANSLAPKGFGLCLIDINEKGLAEVERELQELLGTQCPRIIRLAQNLAEPAHLFHLLHLIQRSSLKA